MRKRPRTRKRLERPRTEDGPTSDPRKKERTVKRCRHRLLPLPAQQRRPLEEERLWMRCGQTWIRRPRLKPMAQERESLDLVLVPRPSEAEHPRRRWPRNPSPRRRGNPRQKKHLSLERKLKRQQTWQQRQQQR